MKRAALALAGLLILCGCGTVHPPMALSQTIFMPSGTNPWAINDTISVGTADSSLVYKTGAYRLLALHIKIETASGAATPSCRLAVQVRAHALETSSSFSAVLPDSEGVAVWHPSEEFSIVSTGVADSLGYGVFRDGSSVVQHDGEIVVRSQASTGGKWGKPDAIYLPLNGYYGLYTSIRVRVLSASNNTPRVKVLLVGIR